MLAKSVPACYRSVGLVTEDAGPRAGKSTNHGQLPDIWKLVRTRRDWSGAHHRSPPGDDEQRPHKPRLVICATYATDGFMGLWSI